MKARVPPTRRQRRPRSGRRIGLGLLLGAAIGFAASAQQGARRAEIADLAARQDPLDDDWESEALYARASDALHALLDALAADPAADLEPWLAPGAVGTQLAPLADARRHELGDLVLWRADLPAASGAGVPPVLLARALREWLEPLRADSAPRVAFKIVDVDMPAPGAQAPFATTILVSVAGRRAGVEVQQNATWRVEWELGEDQAARARGLQLARFEEVRAPAPLFEECTGSVLPSDALLRQQLARGGEYWFGRMDALGEWNYFGHNGLALGDADGDGLDDLYVAMGTGLPNKLLVRQHDGSTRDVALEAGVAWLDDTKGVLFLDYDNDGDQDLFCAIGPTVVLSENDGEGHFTPARSLRAATDAAFYSLAAADYDLDGDLDLYATRYVKSRYGESLPIPFHDAHNGPRNHLLRNDHPEGFTDVTDRVGLGVGNDRFSLAASWEDYDQDGDPDLYVANDFGRNNLYRNDEGRFTEVAPQAGVEDMSAGMGVSWGDVDLDGDADLLVSNMFSAAGQRVAYQPRFEAERDDSAGLIQRHTLGNSLFLNEGDGRFRDVSDAAGIRMGRWAWGAELVDFTADGLPDIAVPNGFLTNALDDDL